MKRQDARRATGSDVGGRLTGAVRYSANQARPLGEAGKARAIRLETTLVQPGRRRMWAQIISDRMEDKVFSWFSTKQAKAFGLELASIVVEHVPNSASMADKKGQSKINYAKEKMQKRIRQFKREEVLNFFKTAKLLNEFKWALKDAGYSKELADSLSSWVFIGLRTQNF